ncbi:MAG: Bro-N domain-containing protein [Bacteroidales bacterium]|nr:Bro-N domain-containing protein [Bacteroidales bacterium]
MTDIERIQSFEDKKVRTVWIESEEKWYFVLEDVIEVLTESKDAKQYIKRMKLRDPELAKGWVQIVPLLSIKTEGGPQKMRCVNMEGMFRIIQSIPSKKAEPFKQWMASVAAERVNQMIDPERGIDQAIADYRRLGYSEAWITQRIKTIEIRKGLTDEWKRGGVTQEVDFALLTDLMSKTWSGLTTREYKKYKGLTKENLRDNMTNMELLLNALAEETATQISKARNPEGLGENAEVAQEGAEVAKSAREEAEKRIGHSVISPKKAIDHIQSPEQIPFSEPDSQEEDKDY